jgi:hypothetical protein
MKVKSFAQTPKLLFTGCLGKEYIPVFSMVDKLWIK